MELSARNQIPGRVSSIQIDGLMAEVTIDLGNGNVSVQVQPVGVCDRADPHRLWSGADRDGVTTVGKDDVTTTGCGPDWAGYNRLW